MEVRVLERAPVAEEAKDKLAALARSTRRSANFIAAEVITEYVAVNAWQVEETRKERKAEPGRPFAATTWSPGDDLLDARWPRGATPWPNTEANSAG